MSNKTIEILIKVIMIPVWIAVGYFGIRFFVGLVPLGKQIAEFTAWDFFITVVAIAASLFILRCAVFFVVVTLAFNNE
jgi:hypothetical protein